MARVDLGEKLGLNLCVVDGGAAVGRRRNNLKQSVERAVPNRLIGASGGRSIVLAKQSDEPAAGRGSCTVNGAALGEISRAASRSAAGLPKDRSFASLADTSPRGDGRAAGGAAETTGKTAVAAEREVCGLIGTDALAR